MSHQLVIRTPEGIEFAHVLASPVSRGLALAIDLACVTALTSLTGGALKAFAALSPDVAGAVIALAYFIIGSGYGILMEHAWRGQTIGKRLMRLRVIDDAGLRLELGQVVVRNLLRAIDCLPAFYLVGGISALVTRKFQRLGDLAAGTVVVRIPHPTPIDIDQIQTGHYNSLRDHPHLEARMRQRVSPEEAALLLQAVLRRDEFEPEARLRLFAELADRLHQSVAFPESTTENLTPEQYVRNAVEILFAPRAGDREPAKSTGATGLER
jgi:uncharacterized RDD family membrane protein YckC